ncbi:uncharacterized protein TRAVEDRAFT_53433 [Trametes versicolor FP-101664 SS1]|uniref:uncharacterized protein n=1 Tax=Trametes versicolor (strain FP-101664) TaxID=717944 RepID=UPI0004623576|nr:uncharacterized protein TRAVEDRAFT_53433 [Trametes versicolor FP-101664 SS1]EIW53016.1 hypothetical protein TRAVEDRAFT_53433 [Trametes versicolor FP-101664 SS1]
MSSSIFSGLSRLMPRSSMNAVGINLALACIESLLYGMFFVLAMTSLAVLVGRHTNRASSFSGRSFTSDRIWTSPLFVATMFLLATVTSHWLITVRRVFDAFVYYEAGQDPMAYYLTVEAPTQVIGTAFVVATVIVGDIILTYRIWTVWDRRWALIVFPTLCTLAYTALGVSMVQLFASYEPNESIFMSAARHRVIPTSALTLATNLYGTGMNDSISDMVEQQGYEAQSHVRRCGAQSLRLVIFIESAAFYTFWTLFFVVSFSANSLLEQFAFHCIPAATGISFMLIVVRVGLGFHWSQITGVGISPAGLAHGRRPSMRKPALTYPPRAITLNVTRTIEQETDYALRMSPEPSGSRHDVAEMC